VQSRILCEVSGAPNLASTVMGTSFQVGIALSAAIRGSIIASGWGYGQVAPGQCCSLALWLVGTLTILARDRRRRAALA
jgi:predicted MFS family arabinose efflux permease